MPPDQKAELFHAILYRKGARTLKVGIEPGEVAVSLADRARSIFDTTT